MRQHTGSHAFAEQALSAASARAGGPVVLGIETSCDETAAAVVAGGSRVLSSVVASQVAQHRPYGGVVPEIASRKHVEWLPGVVREAVMKSGLSWPAIDMVAFTSGPGLANALLTGVSAAKGLALALGRPLVGVNHLEAHVYSVFIGDAAPEPASVCPLVALMVSGGHTCLVRVDRPGAYRLLGETIDDAAGEAFDKGANLLGLGYPGGPAIDKAARGGNPAAAAFPRSLEPRRPGAAAAAAPNLDFSFSGLKTALRYHLRDRPGALDGNGVADLAASYQEAIVDALVEKTRRALPGARSVAAVGGVALNSRLRARMAELAAACGVRLLLAKPAYCADNAAMVAGLAGSGEGITGAAALLVDADPNLRIGV